MTVRGTGGLKWVTTVADLAHVDRSEKGDIKAEQIIAFEYVSILIGREENKPSSVSRNKSVEGLQCPDSRW